jgi:acetylglutamate kinase
VNADTIASRIAISLSGIYDVQLLYCFDQNGVLADMNHMDSVIEVIDSINYPELRSRGIIATGMIPKIENAFDSIEAGVKKVHILNAGKLDQFISGKTGTTICRER